MKMRKRLSFTFIFVLSILILLFSGFTFFRIEMDKKPVVAGKLKEGDYSYLYDFYLRQNPDLLEGPYYGESNAPIHIIAYLNIDSPPSKVFIEEIFPTIDKEYIQTGKAKYYVKYYITQEDLTEKNENYIYAATLECVNQLKKDAYFDFYLNLFEYGQLKDLLDQYEISEDLYRDCIEGFDNNKLYEDISEVENFGMAGLNQRFYIGINQDNVILDGVPDLGKFQRTLRQLEISIGE